MDNKDLCFLGSSKQDIVNFPDDARREAGYQLGLIQSGEEPDDFKPFLVVAKSVKLIVV